MDTIIQLERPPLIKNASQICDSSFREINSQEEFITKPLRYIMVVDLRKETLPTDCDLPSLVSLAMHKEKGGNILDNSIKLMESKSYPHGSGIERVELKFMLNCTTYRHNNSRFSLVLLAHGVTLWRSAYFRTLARKKDTVPRYKKDSGVHTKGSANSGSTRVDQHSDTPSRKRGIQKKKASATKRSNRRQKPQQDASSLSWTIGQTVEVSIPALHEEEEEEEEVPCQERSQQEPLPIDFGSTIWNIMETESNSGSMDNSVDTFPQSKSVDYCYIDDINHHNDHQDSYRSMQDQYFFGSCQNSSDFLVSQKSGDIFDSEDQGNDYQKPDIVTLFS